MYSNIIGTSLTELHNATDCSNAPNETEWFNVAMVMLLAFCRMTVWLPWF